MKNKGIPQELIRNSDLEASPTASAPGTRGTPTKQGEDQVSAQNPNVERQ